MSNPLFDTDFLQQLDAIRNKKIFVAITAIDILGHPQETIEGLVQNGNLNIDGASAIRRSCSLTITANNNTEITDVYWAFKNQFKLEIGVENTIDIRYPAIIWFPQGQFVINNFTKTQNNNGSINIQISGQDKMCLLNGSLGGTLTEEVDFGTVEEIQSDGSVIEHNLPLVTILQQSMTQYGGERLDKVIINDLDQSGLEPLEYKGEDPLYLIYQLPSEKELIGPGGIILAITIDPNVPVWQGEQNIKVSEISNYFCFNGLDPEENKKATRVSYSPSGQRNCVVVKIQYGQIIGYKETELTYAGKLVLNAGTAFTQMLDKIKTQLGAYEYFYDIDGNFIFQKKKDYIQSLFSPINGDIIEPYMLASPYAYRFDNLSLISSISFSPKVSEIKNDFSIIGERQGVDTKISIRVRYAIDKKPTSYYGYAGDKFYYTKDFDGIKPLTITGVQCDWREIIYQMAKDNLNHSLKEDFLPKIAKQNSYMVNYKTGYEAYYAIIYGFWRQLYYMGKNENELPIGYQAQDYYPQGHEHEFWHKNVYLNPNQIDFWFDFLDVGDGPLNTISKNVIGSRQKVSTNKQTTTVFQNDIPEVVFYSDDQIHHPNSTYSYLWIPKNTEDLFSKAPYAPSLISQVNDLIYTHCCCPETITLNTLPIYYLQPNTRIYVRDIGDLVISKISYALGHNATMSLSCTKVVNSIY